VLKTDASIQKPMEHFFRLMGAQQIKGVKTDHTISEIRQLRHTHK